MMVPALSGSVRFNSTCRDSKVAQVNVVRSIGLSRFGWTEVTAFNRLMLGLFLHSASSAKPKDMSASPYMWVSPVLPTAYPKSHITVLIESGFFAASALFAGSVFCGGAVAGRTSFSYLSQLTVA